MKCKGNFKQWFNVFLVISEASQGCELKAFEITFENYHPKSAVEPEIVISDYLCYNLCFPTQDWADTVFYTSFWERTYTSLQWQ